MEFETTCIFDWNYNSDARININQGGSSSSKSYSILQVLLVKAIERKRVITVIGQDLPMLKLGVIRDFNERILVKNPEFNKHITKYNKSEQTYFFTNGSIIEFSSFSDSTDARSGKRDIAFFNEANGIPYAIYEQIAMRTTETIYLDYNPSEEFWVHERLMGKEGTKTFYSNFTHNPFINTDIVNHLRSLKDIDIESWKVYGLGMQGKIAELVFPNFTIVESMPDNLRKRGYGMDFGYKIDPTALIDCGLMNERDIYFDEVIFGYGMKRQEINEAMIEKGVWRNRDICADSSEARLIDDLVTDDWNIYGVTKGAGSIKYGIDLMNDYNIFITENSVNLIKEFKRYKHKIDRRTGKMLNEPIDAWNHGIDSARYWSMDNLKPLNKARTGIKRGN